jgi:hypothetical protein
LVKTIPTEDTHGPVCRNSLVTGLVLCALSGRKRLSARLPTICPDLQRQHIWLPVVVARRVPIGLHRREEGPEANHVLGPGAASQWECGQAQAQAWGGVRVPGGMSLARRPGPPLSHPMPSACAAARPTRRVPQQSSYCVSDAHWQDWGEQYVGRKASRLYVADLARGTVSEVRGIPEDAAAGDATWAPDGSGLVYSGFPIPERRLGLIYWCVVLIGGNPRRPPRYSAPAGAIWPCPILRFSIGSHWICPASD